MPSFTNNKRNVLSAIALGFLAFGFNSLVESLIPNAVPIGNLFIFLSAGSLGISGGLTSVAIGVLPSGLAAGESLYVFKMILLTGVLGIAFERSPRVPLFLVTAATWIFLLAPLELLTTGQAVFFTQSKVFLFQGLIDVLLTMVAGAVLLNKQIRGWITQKPHPYSLNNMLIHVVSLLSALTMFGAFAVAQGSSSVESSSGALFMVILLGISIPAVVAWRLSQVLVERMQEFLPEQFLARKSHTFSGLSSEFWRRAEQGEADYRTKDIENRYKDGAEHSEVNLITRSQIWPDSGICALNKNGTVTFINERFRSLCDVTLNNVVGKKLDSLGLDPSVLEHLTGAIERTFEFGPTNNEIRLESENKLRFLEIKTQMPDENTPASLSGGPESVILTIKDITERRTIEGHLLQAQKLRSLGKFVQGIGHAFNNTLTTIAGQASFARHAKEDGQVESSLQEILSCAQSAGKLVHSLLDFAAESKDLHQVFDLKQEIISRKELLKQLIGERYEISYNLLDGDFSIEGDLNLILQAVTNLLLSARDSYEANSGEIQLSLGTEEIDERIVNLHPGARAGKFARLRVQDQGRGIRPDLIDKVFDPLHSQSIAGGHHNLGLSIVYAIVRASDGFLVCESTPNKGTTVSIYLPIVEEHVTCNASTVATGQKKMKNSSELLNGNNETILVVEDEPDVRELVATMLSTLGYLVESCASGVEALAICEDKRFDLVLVDMMMPKMNGTEVVSKLRAEHGPIRTLVMTGYGVPGECDEYGNPIIPKPFDLDTLSKTVHRVLSTELKEKIDSGSLAV